MDQQPRLAPSALRHALRALVLLGGVVVCWLLLSGGPAQASDDGPSPLVDQVADTATQPVRDVGTTTDSVTQTLRALPTRTTDTVAAATKDAPAPVRTTVEALVEQVEPVLTATTSTVADTVDSSMHTTQAAVGQAVHVVHSHQVAGTPAPSTSSATRTHAASRASQPHRSPARHVVRTAAPATDVTFAHLPALSAAQVAPGGPAAPVRGPQRESAPTVPVAPTAPTGGSSPSAVLAGLILIPATARLRRRNHDDASLPTSPAYPPGSSPG